MSEIRESVGRLQLVGYEKLTDHGFALPVFGQPFGANVFYTADCMSPGATNAQIAGFVRYDPEALVLLPDEQVRETGVGEPWLDVFLWGEVAYVGTAPQIWGALAEVRETIAERAPLSLLALAEGVEHGPAVRLAQRAFSWLTRRYGSQKALEWRRDTYLRGIVLKTLRRELGASAYKAEIRRALQQKMLIREVGNEINVFLGSAFSFLGPEDFNAFADVAAGFGLKATFTIEEVTVMQPRESATRQGRVVRPRTSEDEMRIAALQVAASRPHGKATMTEIKNEVGQYVSLTSEDLLPSETRPNEKMFQQIVGNIVSHRHRQSRNNIFVRGWAIYTGDGIQITDAGRQHLRSLGL
jgi:hypothetical protein